MNNHVKKALVDNIPVIYIEPENTGKKPDLAIFLHGLSGVKEELVPYLEDIANKGYLALAFDKYQHGERGTESATEIMDRVFSNMRRYGWPILGQTALDTLRVIEWSIENLNVTSNVYMGGISMGGDISMVVAGLDSRIVKVAPIVTTPDWLRPGMHDLSKPEIILDPGTPDSYAEYFYENFNPITNISRYVNTPPMRLQLGRQDNHIPPENAERFKKMLGELSPKAAEKIEIVYLEEGYTNHMETINRSDEWWPALRDWWLD